MRFHVENMTCEGCVRSVTKVIQKLDPAAEVKVDLAAKSVEVRTDRPSADIEAALDKVGYPTVAA